MSGHVLAVLQRYLPSDWTVSLYLAVTAVVMACWGEGVRHRHTIVLLHLALLIGVFSLVGLLSDVQSRTGRFFRLLYVPLTVTFFYEEASLFLQVFHQGWFDHRIIAFEEALLGGCPNVWLKSCDQVLVNEWMMLGYLSYYFLVGVPPLVLFFQRRDREAVRLVWAQSLAFFISYVGFMVYPVQGPRFELAGQFAHPLHGFAFVPLVDVVMERASIRGGCMPSSHVAVALVCLMYLLRYHRAWGLVCIPLVVSLCAGTVYGRFHYVSDVAVGLVVGFFSVWVSTYYPKDEWLARAVRPRGAIRSRTP